MLRKKRRCWYQNNLQEKERQSRIERHKQARSDERNLLFQKRVLSHSPVRGVSGQKKEEKTEEDQSVQGERLAENSGLCPFFFPRLNATPVYYTPSMTQRSGQEEREGKDGKEEKKNFLHSHPLLFRHSLRRSMDMRIHLKRILRPSSDLQCSCTRSEEKRKETR